MNLSHRFEQQVADTIAAIDRPDGVALAQEIAELFKRHPDREWRYHIEDETAALVGEHEGKEQHAERARDNDDRHQKLLHGPT